jgi:DNA-binding transcriptional regulator LsrR (DeoR family)
MWYIWAVTVPDNGEGPIDAALTARICWYYFKEGQTQDAIAQRLKTARKRVNRILGEARDGAGADPTTSECRI